MTDITEALLAAMPVPALLIDAGDRIAAANAGAKGLIGQRILGRSYITMLRQPALLEAVEATQADGAARTAAYFSNDGAQATTFRVHCRAVPDAGQVLLSFEDVTQVNAVGQMRRDFVANVSHELRTPLTALMGFIETLRGPARSDAAAQERFLSIMMTQAERMNRLVGDLLSLSRVEEGARVRPRDDVALRACLDGVITLLRPGAEEAGVHLLADLGDAPVSVPGDRDQLTQVASNLIENAIKYGAAGGQVSVHLSVSDMDPLLRAAGARIEVRDKGAGIDPQHLPRLTERFYRADSHRSRDLGGTGLGLAIVKHIVNRHRGRLQITSTPGQGTAVVVVLPLQIAASN